MTKIELATLLGRRPPYSVTDMLFVYFTRDVPITIALTLLALLLMPSQLITKSEILAEFGGIGTFVLAAVLILPVVETIIFVLLVIFIPPTWYRSSSKMFSTNAREIIFCVLCGALFGALHLSNSVVSAVTATWGGIIMFAVLLQHWSYGALYRGIVMCWALHFVHNLISVAAFIWLSN
jgi:hypothetical protein